MSSGIISGREGELSGRTGNYFVNGAGEDVDDPDPITADSRKSEIEKHT